LIAPGTSLEPKRKLASYSRAFLLMHAIFFTMLFLIYYQW